MPTAEHWAALEAKLGPLPRDFHDFHATYGSGYLGSFLWIYNPASRNCFNNFTAYFDQTLGILREIRDAESELGIVIFPDQYGWLPFGITDMATTSFGAPPALRTSGRLSLCRPGIHGWNISPSTTGFLASIYDGSLKACRFPDDVPGGDFSFVLTPPTQRPEEIPSRQPEYWDACPLSTLNLGGRRGCLKSL